MPEQHRDKAVERWLRQTPAPGPRSESACLDAETLAAWAEGLLNGSERTAAEAHASGCARCQAMLAVMVRTMPATPPRSASPLRKWLMMLSPAMAAAAAVALWFAVDQRSLPPASDSLRRVQEVASQPSEAAKPSAASPAAATEKDARGRASDGSFDETLRKREAPQSELQASKALLDAVKEREERAGADKKMANEGFARAKPSDERKDKDDVRAPQAVGRLAAVPSTAAPVAAAESLRTTAADQSAQARATPPAAPMQQASQNQNPSPNANQSQSENAPRRQAAAPKADPNAGAAERVETVTGKPAVTRDAARSVAGAAPGAAGAALGFRTNAGTFEVVPLDASARWRVVDGRTVQRSLDAGATWASQYSAEDGVMLTAGAAPTPTVCWLIGRAGVIVLTTDGRDWQRVKFPEPVDLTAVTSTDARTATVTTANGRRFLTTDGGRNWTPR